MKFFGHNVLSGGDGCVAGLSNFAPEVASGYADRARREDLAGMQEYQQKIDELMAIYDVAPQFVPVIKKSDGGTGSENETVLCASRPPCNGGGDGKHSPDPCRSRFVISLRNIKIPASSMNRKTRGFFFDNRKLRSLLSKNTPWDAHSREAEICRQFFGRCTR